MKGKLLAALSISSAIILAGCGAPTAAGQPGAVAQAATSAHAAPHRAVAPTLKLQHISLTVLPGSRLGPDKIMHDAFSLTDFKVVQGVPTQVTVYNYDGGTHSITSAPLGLNVTLKGSPKEGVPGVTTFTFTPKKTGAFTWECVLKCDGQAKGWAMSHDGYMKGVIHVVPNKHQQFIDLTIKDGLQYAAADKKIHDSYSPANFTVTAGIPVHVTVVNFDTGSHSLTSPTLGLNQIFKGAAKTGIPSVSTFTFTPKKTGNFHWQCVIPCDGGPTGWAMSHNGYMNGTITVVK